MAPVATATLSLREEKLEITNDLPLDKKIEQIIKGTGEIRVRGVKDSEKNITGPDPEGLEILPEVSKQRMRDSGIDISKGYPEVPDHRQVPVYVDEAFAIRNEDYPYVDRGKNADPEKKALFGAATEVVHLTKHIGTEIVGLQLADLNDQQKDELALLIAERAVVFFRDQKLSPQKQWDLGDYWGQIEKHAQIPHVPGLKGATVIWNDYRKKRGMNLTFKNANYGNFNSKHGDRGNQIWHSDLVHEHQPAGYTHLHLDAIPEVGGDTLWASGYAAYDKLSEEMKRFLDGKKAVFCSAHAYLDRDDPFGGPKRIERVHPLVRTHPATGWKSLYVNRGLTVRIVGLSPVESDVILNYLYDVYEKNADIQVRFNWKPSKQGYGTSAIWDNRISQHRNVWDHEGVEPRHGTRVTSLAEVPYFDQESKSQREALGLPLED